MSSVGKVDPPQSLYDLLKARHDQLISCWTSQARKTVAPGPLPQAELLDHMPAFVDEIIAALYPTALPLPPNRGSAEEHGVQRLRLGFDVSEVVREYGLLHHCILALAREAGLTISLRDQDVVCRWLNQGIADAVAQYVQQRDLERQRQESEHIGFLAHELRNPLGAARLAFTRLTFRELAEGGRAVELLDRNLRRAAEMIESALVQASLRMGIEPRLERIDLPAFLREIERDAAVEAQAKQITIAVVAPDELFIDADPRLLRSALTNLVGNAIKFSSEGGRVVMGASRREGRVTIDVADSCGGLPPGKAEELFAPLVQRGDDHTGYGLGLAIALQAAEAHAGTITLRDVPGQGCVFTVALPIAAPA
jgi:signal transduction histidine kinase